MFGETKSSSSIGVLLVLAGALALLATLGLFNGVGSLFSALLFAALGAYLVRLGRSNPRQLWAFIAGFGLFGLALAAISGALAGSYFLLMLGAGFALLYRQDERRWWAMIPAGALFTLAAVAGLEALLPRIDGGPLFFLGLAATFGLVYRNAQPWAVYPAIGMAVLAVLSASFTSSWLLPIALLGGGLYLLSRKKRHPEPEASEASPSEVKALAPADLEPADLEPQPRA